MLVPSMTNEEITKAVIRDFRKIEQSHLKRLHEDYHKERKRLKIEKRNTWSKEYAVQLPLSKTEWKIVMQKNPCQPCYKDMEDATGSPYTSYFGPQGLRVFRPYENSIEVFNGHFFTRYNERMNLNLHHQTDVIQRFFFKNSYMLPETMKHNGKEYIMSVCKDGAALGQYHDETPYRWLVHNTFITTQQMHKSQAEGQFERMSDSLKSMTDAMVKANPNNKEGITETMLFEQSQRILLNMLARA